MTRDAIWAFVAGGTAVFLATAIVVTVLRHPGSNQRNGLGPQVSQPPAAEEDTFDGFQSSRVRR